MRFRWSILLLLIANLIAQAPTGKRAPSPQTVVFLCEHGAAKSVIAAAYFNKLAAERHLNYYAVARGTDPQAELSESAVAGLRKDGISFPEDKPRQVSDHEVRNASRVVAFCTVPPRFRKKVGSASYDVPAPKEDYEKSRDAILTHVKKLLDELEATKTP